MYWNHRLMKRTEHDETLLYVVEVYYDSKDNSIIGWTEKESVYGENLDEVRQTLSWMIEALDKPILDEVELLLQIKPGHEIFPESTQGFNSIEELVTELDTED